MRDYIYDNTFHGYLTAIFTAYSSKDIEARICRELLYEGSLLSEVITIYNDLEKSSRVMKGIYEKLGVDWLEHLYKVFLSEDLEGDTIGYRAIRYGFKNGKKVLEAESHELIQPFLKLSRKVSRETHNFLGYIRFSELESGVFYSEFQPTYNILPLLAPHFADRLKDQSFVIHDSKRGIAMFYNTEKWHIDKLTDLSALKLSKNELEMQSLWRGYFEALAITERRNLKLQQQKIPKKYWRFFTEDIGVFEQHDIIKCER